MLDVLMITPPLPEADHARGGFARAEEHAGQIDVDDRAPLLQRHLADDLAVLHLDEQRVLGDAGVVDHHVEPAEVARRRRRACSTTSSSRVTLQR